MSLVQDRQQAQEASFHAGLFVVAARSRPAVVLSSSLGTERSMWDAQVALLATRFSLVRYDTRRHGASSAPPGPYTIPLLGGDVLALLDHLDIDRAHFVGLSMGGVTGQWLGAHAPGRLHKLVLANTASKIGTLTAAIKGARW